MSLNSILKSVTGQTGTGLLKSLGKSETVRDYQHAARLFVDNNYALAPKYQFLYHVYFKINPSVISRLSGTWDSLKKAEAGMLVKSVDLPKFKIDTKTLNAYNKSHVVQTKIKYDPISIILHDDTANVIRDMWFAYLSYYYKDSDHVENSYNRSNVYNRRLTDRWGYQPNNVLFEGGPPFFSSIQIYSLSQKKFSLYELINPMIESFEHGRHEASQGTGVMEHTIRVSYEAVKYKEGLANGGAVSGFGQEHYDRQPSPLTPLGGGTKSILGPGGLIDSASSITQDLAEGNLLKAGFTALRAGQNLKNFNIKDSIKTEASELVTGAIRNTANSASPFSFPSINTVTNSATRINSALQTLTGQSAAQSATASSNVATSQGQPVATVPVTQG